MPYSTTCWNFQRHWMGTQKCKSRSSWAGWCTPDCSRNGLKIKRSTNMQTSRNWQVTGLWRRPVFQSSEVNKKSAACISASQMLVSLKVWCGGSKMRGHRQCWQPMHIRKIPAFKKGTHQPLTALVVPYKTVTKRCPSKTKSLTGPSSSTGVSRGVSWNP